MKRLLMGILLACSLGVSGCACKEYEQCMSKGKALLKKGHYEEALSAFKEAAKQKQDTEEAQRYMAFIEYIKGNSEFQRIRKLKSTSPLIPNMIDSKKQLDVFEILIFESETVTAQTPNTKSETEALKHTLEPGQTHLNQKQTGSAVSTFKFAAADPFK